MTQHEHTTPVHLPAGAGSWWDRLKAAGWVALLLTLVTFVVAYELLPFRGTNLWGVWLEQGSSAVQSWLSGRGAVDGAFGAATLDRAWAGQAALPPATVFLIALARAAGLSFGDAGHLVSATATALTVPLVWGLARRSGGPPAAATATLALLFVPRVLGHATEAGFSAPAMFGVTFAVYALYRARVSVGWTLAAVVAVPLATLFTHLGPLLLIPWLLLLLGDKGQVSTLLASGRDPDAQEGYLLPRGIPLRLLAVPLTALPLTVAFHPWTWAAPTERLWAYLSHFLVRPKPSFLYLGELLTTARLPWHGGIVLALVTMPPVLASLGAFGLLGEILLRPVFRTAPGARLRAWIAMRPDPEAAGAEAWEAKRWAFAFLMFTWVLPWLFGAPWFGVVDLIALSAPFFAVFVGCSMSRLFMMTATLTHTIRLRPLPEGLRRVLTWGVVTSLGTILFLPPLLQAVEAQPIAESYYSWLVGGTDGAVALGLPRSAHGPIPLPVVRHLADQNARLGGRARLHVVADAATWRSVMGLYERTGLVAGLPPVAGWDQAEILLLPHADMDAAYYAGAADFARAIPPERSAVLRGGTLRLVTVGVIRRP